MVGSVPLGRHNGAKLGSGCSRDQSNRFGDQRVACGQLARRGAPRRMYPKA